MGCAALPAAAQPLAPARSAGIAPTARLCAGGPCAAMARPAATWPRRVLRSPWCSRWHDPVPTIRPVAGSVRIPGHGHHSSPSKSPPHDRYSPLLWSVFSMSLVPVVGRLAAYRPALVVQPGAPNAGWRRSKWRRRADRRPGTASKQAGSFAAASAGSVRARRTPGDPSPPTIKATLDAHRRHGAAGNLEVPARNDRQPNGVLTTAKRCMWPRVRPDPPQPAASCGAPNHHTAMNLCRANASAGRQRQLEVRFGRWSRWRQAAKDLNLQAAALPVGVKHGMVNNASPIVQPAAVPAQLGAMATAAGVSPFYGYPHRPGDLYKAGKVPEGGSKVHRGEQTDSSARGDNGWVGDGAALLRLGLAGADNGSGRPARVLHGQVAMGQ